MNIHQDQFLSATNQKLESHSFRSTILTNLSARIFAVISSTGFAGHLSKDRAFFGAMAELLVAKKTSTEALTKTNTLAKHVRSLE